MIKKVYSFSMQGKRDSNEDQDIYILNFDNSKLNSEQAFDIFINNKILLRKMNTYGIKNSLRVTIGTDEENKTFLDILDKNF